jgi:hypothetical protein
VTGSADCRTRHHLRGFIGANLRQCLRIEGEARQDVVARERRVKVDGLDIVAAPVDVDVLLGRID